MIVQTMRAIAEYDIARAQIARQVQLGQMTPQQADEAYRSLPNPVPEFVRRSAAAEVEAPATPEGYTQEQWTEIWGRMTPEQRRAFVEAGQ